ncbi:hypothetical protein NSK11_contig00080-0003 [Nocardia seriolae]|uniref:Uncharacterized protein n=1 Tax=Nocardia seriolae TaxID=37332 RepID=A0ABC9YYL1_9NOCA|nr:hypothetical protein NS07_v2contig00075-0045 [Nocardia seriolae]GAP30407.1 hypothetical protein NSK11_contig00080-0003 [Nocardia seriolae]
MFGGQELGALLRGSAGEVGFHQLAEERGERDRRPAARPLLHRAQRDAGALGELGLGYPERDAQRGRVGTCPCLLHTHYLACAGDA